MSIVAQRPSIPFFLIMLAGAAAVLYAQRENDATPATGPLPGGLESWSFHAGTEDLDTAEAWRVEDGILICDGAPTGYLASPGEHENYTLTFEWRWPERTKKANSGLLVHAIPGQPGLGPWPLCHEVQLQKGSAGDYWALGQNLSFRAEGPVFKPMGVPVLNVRRLAADVEMPAGQWNHMRVVCRGDTIEAHVNGTLTTRLTAVKPNRGRICLQSEGAEIHFRNLQISPLQPDAE